MKKIIILGGNGRVGRAAAIAFYKAEFDVTMVTRDGTARNLKEDIKLIAGNAMDQHSVISVTKNCDFVFNGLNPIYTKWPEQVLPMARNIVAAGKANKFIHLFPGNLYNYGSAMPPIIDANTPYLADTKKGKIRIEMEALFKETAQTHGMKTIVLRAGDFFGGIMPGSWLDEGLTRKLNKGIFTAPGPMDVLHSWAYLPDLAKTFVKLAEESDELGNWSDFRFTGHCITNNAFKISMEKGFRQPLRTEFLPWRILRLLSWVNPMMREVCELAYQWETPHKLVDPELEILIGPIPHTPFDTAVYTALRDLNLMPYESMNQTSKLKAA